MTLRVTVDGAPLSVTWSGVARYVAGVVNAAAEHDPELNLSMLMYARRPSGAAVPISLSPRLRAIEMSLVRSRAVSGLARFACPVPLHALTDADVTLVTRYWGTGGRGPSVAFVYDTVWRHLPETVEAGYLPRLTKLAERAIENASCLVVMSEAVRNELRTIDRSAPDRAVVVPPARHVLPYVSEDAAQALLRVAGLNLPFVLFVGRVEPRKNLDRLLDAWDLVADEFGPATLVVAGRRGWQAAGTARRLEMASNVRWLSPDDRMLAALYRKAAALVLPSLYEGYGLPIAEAADAGLPIACSDLEVFREVGSAASVTFFDPSDAEDIAAGIVSAARQERTVPPTGAPAEPGEKLAAALRSVSR